MALSAKTDPNYVPKRNSAMDKDATKATVGSGTERMRRHRQRRRLGLRSVTIEVRRSEVDTLIARRLLAPEERADRSALRKAIHRFLDMTLVRAW
jgi:hypothetical protein